MVGTEFERYVEMYRQSVWSAALCYVKNTSDADDITQDVFLKLYTYNGSFESDEHLKAWLLRCAINRSKDILRSHWYRFSEPLESASVKEYSRTDLTQTSLIPELMKLSLKNRTVLYMHYYEGYSVEQTAKLLHLKVSAVKLRLMRGREQLKKLLTEERKEYDDQL